MELLTEQSALTTRNRVSIRSAMRLVIVVFIIYAAETLFDSIMWSYKGKVSSTYPWFFKDVVLLLLMAWLVVTLWKRKYWSKKVSVAVLLSTFLLKAPFYVFFLWILVISPGETTPPILPRGIAFNVVEGTLLLLLVVAIYSVARLPKDLEGASNQ